MTLLLAGIFRILRQIAPAPVSYLIAALFVALNPMVWNYFGLANADHHAPLAGLPGADHRVPDREEGCLLFVEEPPVIAALDRLDHVVEQLGARQGVPGADAVSDGRTACDFFARLAAFNPQLAYAASDYQPTLRIIAAGACDIAPRGRRPTRASAIAACASGRRAAPSWPSFGSGPTR